MQPKLKIGILSHPQISVTLAHVFVISGTNQRLEKGTYSASREGDDIRLTGNNINILAPDFLLTSASSDDTFVIHNVVIGINFHWERREDQCFSGYLQLLPDLDQIVAINHAPIEQYLTSVISSEMSATSSPELLKAHAVISRSWVMAQVEKNQFLKNAASPYNAIQQTDDELIRWYDREDHLLFDVCADDHCQRYQGLTRVTNNVVNQAIADTFGLVLTYNNTICDARFSKCCGGVSERFENCWEPVSHPYLQAIRDDAQSALTDLTTESGAREWILSNPPAFCNTHDKLILNQVLNNYDQETTRFYRWQVSYTQEELSHLVAERTGIDFGIIENLEPLERGESGRIIRLRIVGRRKTLIIGKELEIRKTLSSTHLYSSAFIVKKTEQNHQIQFVLHGAGWGHGVGLCQIGAAVMGAQGYTYENILMHYFKGASLSKRY